MTRNGAPLGKEDSLNLAFADKLVKSQDFVCWLLSRTKFSKHAADARLLYEEQALARTARFWWRHWWCNLEELGGGSETDIFLVFEIPATYQRFCLHIENKITTSTFTPNQEYNYAVRARYMLGNTKSAQFRCTDFDTVLIAPKSFCDQYRKQCDVFGQFIAHEDIAPFVPEFGGAQPETTLMPSVEHSPSANRFACPQCGSENTQKITLVYGAGTSNYSSRSLSTGTALSRRSNVRFTTTAGTTNSVLAQQHAPPAKKSFNGLGCGVSVLILGGLAGALSGSGTLAIFVLLVAAGVALAQIGGIERYNRSDYLRRYEDWAEQFICLRCGNKFRVAQSETSRKFAVILKSVGANKINVIAIVREVTHLGLAEAKRLVESAPTVVIADLPREPAETISSQFQAAGAVAELR